MQILPIASGKGGVGKSLLAANLAIALSQAGKKVVLVDLDLGGSNLHLILGIRSHAAGVGAFLTERGADFDDLRIQTEFSGLEFIAGDSEIPGLANISSGQKRLLIRRLQRIDADYVVADLGAGTSFNIIDFFLASGQGIVVTTPTPTATVNAYLFLKNTMFRIMTSSFPRKSPAYQYLEQLRKDSGRIQRLYIPQLLEHIATIDPSSHVAYRTTVGNYRPFLVLNLLDDPKDADKITRLRRSCLHYLGIDVEHLGVIYRDELQDIALQSQLPIIIYKPNSLLSQAVYRIADKIVQLATEPFVPFEMRDVDESYESAGLEAEVDFESKMEYLEDLLHTGALTTGDLVETVKMQQLELRQLRKENQLLKAKILRAAGEGYRV